jgi:DNA topoisomerase-1
VPRGADPATLTLEDARALIEARAGAPPRGRRPATRSKAYAPAPAPRATKIAADAGEATVKKSATRKAGSAAASQTRQLLES